MITDCHTHAFPDGISDRAVGRILESAPGVRAWLDGCVSSLLSSMDRAGIDRSVVCSIATKPTQFPRILSWSEQIRSDRIVPFPSLHPLAPEAPRQVGEIAAAGFKGIKLHPYYQDYVLDHAAVYPVYEAISNAGLVLLTHVGFDIAFPRTRRADAAKVARVMAAFPDLRLVVSHLGGWSDWDEGERYLLGRDIYVEISYSLEDLPADRAKALLLKHPADFLLFGTDSPWQDQAAALSRLRALGMGHEWERAVLEDNPARLLADG